MGQIYVDQGKTKGVDVSDPDVNQKIYKQYVKAFEKGVFDFIHTFEAEMYVNCALNSLNHSRFKSIGYIMTAIPGE